MFAYYHSQSYVTDVLAQAARYGTGTKDSSDHTPSDTAAEAVLFALDQVGQPYVWAGDGGAEGRFGCSGLTHAAYAAAGVTIPRTAETPWRAGPAVAPGRPLAPGDLLFYGSGGRATHVALYLGDGQVGHAPDVGQLVQVTLADMPGYLGATRPDPAAGR